MTIEIESPQNGTDSTSLKNDVVGNECNASLESDAEKLPLKVVHAGDVKTTMKDVGGYEEAKLEVIEFVNFIKNRERYEKLGARLPKGALLYGPPGNGKTLLARATAGEGNITFLSCSGSPLLVSSNGPAQLRKVFEVARKHSPCVLFFDEIDCIGRARNHYRGTPESQAMTEELLVQLDGFEQHLESLVIVLGATNEICDMDQALKRPGRFDRTIQMSEPDLPARLSIYNVHLAPLTTNLQKVDIAKKLAILTPGFTGAQIAAVCNEAAMIAARELNDDIKMDHFEQAMDRVRSGLRKRKPLLTDEKRTAAYHDAGHAVAGWFLEGISSPLTKLSVMPNACGKAVCSQSRISSFDNLNKTKAINTVALMLAGRAAQKLFLGEYTTNSGSDLEHATKLATSMITEHGLCEQFDPIWFYSSFLPAGHAVETNLRLEISDSAKDKVFIEISKILKEANEIAEGVLLKHKDKLEKIANELIAKDLLSLEEMEKIFGPNPFFDMETLSLSDENFLPVGLERWNY